MYPATGTVTYEGKQLQYGRVGEALKKGMAFVSEDRKGVGLLLEEPISLNMVYTDMRVNRHFLKKYVFFSQSTAKALVRLSRDDSGAGYPLYWTRTTGRTAFGGKSAKGMCCESINHKTKDFVCMRSLPEVLILELSRFF